MNKLSLMIDYYFDLTDQEPTNYTRHLRAAKQLLCLCDNDTDRACELLDKTKNWVNGFGGEDFTIETSVKYFVEKELKAEKTAK